MVNHTNQIENQLFGWTDWDLVDTGVFLFYNCILNRDIGEYKANQKINAILLNFQQSELIFQDEQVTFHIGLSIIGKKKGVT